MKGSYVQSQNKMSSVSRRVRRAEVVPELIAFRDTPTLEKHLQKMSGAETHQIGHSVGGQPLYGYCLGVGEKHVSIVAGSHADEPVGPMTAQALPVLLEAHFPDALEQFRFHVVPQINPDGADRNRPWFGHPPAFADYAEGVRREPPDQDVEFGFENTPEARPECRAAMAFLRQGAPYAAHFSLHGMPFAEGAWWLLSSAWAAQSTALMDALEEFCRELGMPLHDIDRRGEKGFTRLRPGFSTTPTSTAMRAFFSERGDAEMASKFRPSSMEFVASLGGDPLCMVSEVPLFLLTKGPSTLEDPVFLRFRDALEAAQVLGGEEQSQARASLAANYGVDPVPLERQMRLQLAMILLALGHLPHPEGATVRRPKG